MGNVFISYRRSDSATITGRIYDRLVAKFGRKSVFTDVDDIPAGVDFGTYIQKSVRRSSVVLVIIGLHWLDLQADGSRRIDDPKDWVRIEIETAFSVGLTVIPLLVEGASMPKGPDLPDSLEKLARINGLAVRNNPYFDHDMERVTKAIDSYIKLERRLAVADRWVVGGVALAVAVLVFSFVISSLPSLDPSVRYGPGNGLALLSVALSAIAWVVSLVRLLYLKHRVSVGATLLGGAIAFPLCVLTSVLDLPPAPLIIYYLPYLGAALVPLIGRFVPSLTPTVLSIPQASVQEVKP